EGGSGHPPMLAGNRSLPSTNRSGVTPGWAEEMLFQAMSKFTLADLEQRIVDRAQASPDVSYTRKLLDKGPAQCAKKFGEEAVEAILAVAAEDREHVIGESAD